MNWLESCRRLLHGSNIAQQDPCRPGDSWLFILGVNNSGTTLLSNMLETHPEIRSLPKEGQHATNAFPRPDLVGCPRLWTQRPDLFRWTEQNDPAPALQAKRDWAALYPDRPGILLEKSPPNTIRSRWLQVNFHPARFISIVRHPYAVCEGMQRRKSYTVEQAAHHWMDANMMLLDDMKHLKYCLQFRYTDLVADPVQILEKIRVFIGLTSRFDQNALDEVGAHSYAGVTSGIVDLDAGSFDRLSRSDKQKIEEICGPLMKHYGFS